MDAATGVILNDYKEDDDDMPDCYTADDVTLYVPCFNPDLDLLQKVLKSVLEQSCRPSRIIVFDDGSPEPIPELPGTEVIRYDQNIGLAATRNRLVQMCETPLLAGIDADVVLTREWLAEMLNAINSHDVAGVGGRLDEYYQDTLGDRWRAVHMAQHWGDESRLNPRFLYGANTLFKVEVLAQTGYIDTLKTNYEDMSLSENLYKNNYNLYYQADARCWHYRRDTEHSILRGFWQWYHAKAHLDNHFESPERLLERIDRVNFGIYRYRYDMDQDAGRDEFLQLDALIPWVFCVLDLRFAAKIANIPVPDILNSHLMKPLSVSQHKQLEAILGREPVEPGCPWQDEYFQTFEANLQKWQWGR